MAHCFAEHEHMRNPAQTRAIARNAREIRTFALYPAECCLNSECGVQIRNARRSGAIRCNGWVPGREF